MATQTVMTAEQFDQLPEDELRRFELYQEELIEMSSPRPRHNAILNELLWRLGVFLNASKIGRVLPGTDLAVAPEVRFCPDLSIFTSAQYERIDLDRVPVREMPAIVVEIVSPNDESGRLDQKTLDQKTPAYLEAGVVEVWILNPIFQELTVRTVSGPRIFTAEQIFETAILPGWAPKIGDIFAQPR